MTNVKSDRLALENKTNFERLKRQNRAGYLTCGDCQKTLYMPQKHIQSIESYEAISCKGCIQNDLRIKRQIEKEKKLKIRERQILANKILNDETLTKEFIKREKQEITIYPTRKYSQDEKQQIFKLIKQGFSYKEISDILKISRKNLYKIVADSKRHKDSKYYLNLKIKSFVRGTDIIFTVDDLLNKITTTPKCYLTNKPIDLLKPETYSLDHIIPRSKNGDSSLSNCQIITQEANMVKNSLLLNELYEICETILLNRPR